ncbi:MAG: hypothetical protein R3264_09635, partial [Anaerolineae bacterium]|nr:hypothetical protein [Anaerolineae bacterium]
MIPTLAGRWQTRTLLTIFVGIPVTLGFCLLYNDFTTPLVLLGCVWLLGLLWDAVYQSLQDLRWDRDWPPLFLAVGALIEGLLVWNLVKATVVWRILGLTVLPGIDPELTMLQFCGHYATVWLLTFFVMLGPLKVLFLKWR